ncbi:MAG: histidine phosphatase family protein [Actinobacteria bacterium]|nr:histidine phosphatase family protein [Actinomycetota bacterium]
MATKRLLVLRHAKSSWRTPDIDIRRPLAERGVQDARAAGAILAGYDLDVVLCSSATRARQTWENAMAGGAACDDVRYTEAIYHAWSDELLDEVRTLPEDAPTALLIGHQPTLSDLVLSLAKPSDLTAAVAERFPTSALAVLSYRGAWRTLAEGKATLQRYEIPRG